MPVRDFQTGKPPETAVVVRNATADGTNWAGWGEVETGARPAGSPASDQPLDVAATVFRDRVYVATRWQSSNTAAGDYMGVNFSADGGNWSGWRLPPSTVSCQPAATAGLAAVGNHPYIMTPQIDSAANDNTLVSAH
ncbi:MAG: hypothetical protein ACLP52_26700 [Streptosporangiaceae bacterium]